MATLDGAWKSYNGTVALRGIDLAVRAGEVVALLGPNGAGKTTAQSLLLGQRKPDAGRARLFGGDPRIPANRTRVGATPQDTAFPETLTVREILALVVSHFDTAPAIADCLDRFWLDALKDRQAHSLSGGERRRLAVALAFAGGAEAIFLDEPTTGLDVAARARLWEVARDFTRGGGTLFLTTHYLEEAEALASRIVLINHGAIVRDGTIRDIKAAVDVQKLTFRAPDCPALPGEISRESEGDLHRVLCRDSDAAVRALVSAAVAFEELEVRPVSLEEAVMATLEAEDPPCA